jgi:enoyl-CoA hydratase
MKFYQVPEVIARVEGRCARLTLNRPQALHALTEPMCAAITAALLAWREDPLVDLVLIDHAGDRGFCAGGDIRAMASHGANNPAAGAEFFLSEYRMNELLQRYPKPTCAIMDGVTMGGGVGLSAYCTYRVATERTVFAMPETGIGLFPDIGAGWFLSRLPGEIGTWLALTGARLKAADCLYLNLCSHHVPSNRVAALKDKLAAGPWEARRILARFHDDPGLAPLSGKQAALDGVFAFNTVEQIVAALEAGSSWAKDQAEILKTKSPTSMKVALRELRGSPERPNFADEMGVEYRLACRMIQANDFQEGVRAVVIDKDNSPKWSPARLGDVTEAMLDALFAPFEDQAEFSPIES